MKAILLLSLLPISGAFMVGSHRQTQPFMTQLASAVPEVDVEGTTPISISGNNIEVTPAMSEYVNSKLQKTLGKLSGSRLVNEIACNVYMTVNKNPKVSDGHTCEVTTILKGTTIRVVESTADMYSSIDLVSDRLARKLRKYKERKLDGYHGGVKTGENLADMMNGMDEEAELEEEVDVEPQVDTVALATSDPKITKVKSFDLSKPISIKEAIFALDYIDHDFYVFRDAETNEVSVVYKRNAGGVGLIQPSDN